MVGRWSPKGVVVYVRVLVGGPGAATGPSNTLTAACHSSEPGFACRLAWDLTHSVRAAELTKVYLAGPAQLVIRIGFVILIALVLRLATHRSIRRITARATKDSPNGNDRAKTLLFRERRQQRASALGTILSNAASLTIFGIAAITILGDMGVNLAPVLASAGVLGVAIGFGAQNLVQDFLAGIFMLLEDQYGVGDVIVVGDVTGTVEAVSLRITRLRDVSGVVWHIRNGIINQTGNESQGWARAIVDFPVAYDRDIPRVRLLMTRTAAQMWQEPDWHGVILEEPEVWGVQELSTDEIVVRLVARTAPLRQWEVARELRERLKIALDEPGESGHQLGPGDDDPDRSRPPGGRTGSEGMGSGGTASGSQAGGDPARDGPAGGGTGGALAGP